MRRVALAVLLLLALAAPAQAVTYYIVPNTVTAGPVTFTETYPKAAARQSHHSQFHDNPYTFALCQDATGAVTFSGMTTVDTKEATTGGFLAVTYPLTFPASDCSASIGYFVYDQTGVHWVQVAYVFFEVVPGAS